VGAAGDPADDAPWLAGLAWPPVPLSCSVRRASRATVIPWSRLRGDDANMDVLFILIPLSVVLALAILGALGWAVWRGQFEDVEAEGERILEGD
jgi:cbb3-type cytochrome oxidase maturation protein